MNGNQWGPVGKTISYVLIVGVPVAIWGWLPVLLVFIAFTGVFGIFALAARDRSRQGAAREDAELDAVMASWGETR